MTGAAARFVSASATAIRPDAGRVDDGERRALANRERLARVAVEGRAASSRSRPRAPATARRIWSRAHRPPTVRSPIAMRNVLSATAGARSTRSSGLGDGRSPLASNGRQRRRRRARTSRVMRGGLPSSAGRSMSTGVVAEQRVVHHEPLVVGRRADHRERAALALAERAEARRGDRARWPARSAPAPRCTRPRAASCPALRWAPRAGRCARRGPTPWASLGQRVRQAAGADVVDREDRVARRRAPSSGR